MMNPNLADRPRKDKKWNVPYGVLIHITDNLKGSECPGQASVVS